MKKKVIAISLIMAMVICNSMTVWASSTTWDGTTYTGDSTKPVTASFTKASGNTYSVTIMWDDLSFNYTEQLAWDGSCYNGSDDEAWESANVGSGGQMNSITVSNCSDKKVQADFSFRQDTTYIRDSCITGVFNTSNDMSDITSTNSYPLGTQADEVADEIEQDVYFGVYGAPKNVFLNDGLTNLKIGEVTISLSGIN